MLDPQAESTFQRGIEQLHRGHPREALSFFKAAVDLDTASAAGQTSQARYESYYGLCLAHTPSRLHEALDHCRRAAKVEPYRTAVWSNLGQVAMAAGRRAEAHRALERGRALDPGNAKITKELQRLGVRRPPVMTFLARGNPVNVFLGRMRKN